MSDTAATPASADLLPAWTDPKSAEAYTGPEWASLNVALHAAGRGEMRMQWLASDASIALSVIAEDETASPHARELATQTLRKMRARIEAWREGLPG